MEYSNRMIKDKVATPKCFLFVVPQIENTDSLIEQSVISLLKLAFINSIQLYN